MEPLPGTASVIEIIQIIEAITRIFRRYLNIGRVREAWWDISLLQREIGALSQTLEPLQTLLHNQIPTQAGLLEDITKCSATLSRLRDKIDPETTQTLLSRWEFQRWTWPMTANDVTNVIREIERYKSSFWLSLMLSQTQSHHLVHPKIDLKGVPFNDKSQRIECLPGTQVEVLREIDNWMKSPGTCLFWLTGIAGSGKSTIARTVSSCARRQGILGASFFFKRGEQDRGNAKLLFSTLAKQLGDTISQLSSSIQHVIGKNPDIAGRGLEEQFQKLILQPLIALNPGHPTSTILIVIDALDECGQDRDARDILELLPSVQESRSVQLRFLLTSRPDLPIKLGLQGAMYDQHLIIHEIPNPAIEQDIRLYLNNEFSRLQQERGLPADWPGDKAINILVERTAPSFILAATLVRFVCGDSGSARECLEAILSDKTKYTTKMEGTYMPILNRLLTNTDEEETRQLVHEFKNTIGILILLATPLSLDSFVKLVQIETDTVRKQFKLFQSVLDIPATPDEPVRVSHRSFRDFLLDNKQEESPFWVDKGLVHKRLAVQCLKVMQHGLRKNFCNLQNDTPRNDIDHDTLRHCLPSELQYACRYWVHHLVQSNPVTELSQVVSFLQSHFLHWVEAMSLLGALSEVVEMVQRLQSAIETYGNYELSAFISEAWCYILRNRQIAETSPLQLYSIGLMFTREDSIIKRAFKNESSPWSLAPRVNETGTELSSWFCLVAFSPDGQLLASGADDHTVKVWDPRTGELHQTLKGHLGWVSSVSFSRDSQLLASASFDQTVKVWDARTGELCRTFGGYFHEIYSVTFLPDDQLTTSSGSDTVKVWDVRTGELLKLCE